MSSLSFFNTQYRCSKYYSIRQNSCILAEFQEGILGFYWSLSSCAVIWHEWWIKRVIKPQSIERRWFRGGRCASWGSAPPPLRVHSPWLCLCVCDWPASRQWFGLREASSTVSDLWGSRNERKGEGAVREADSIWNDRRSNRDCTSSQPGWREERRYKDRIRSLNRGSSVQLLQGGRDRDGAQRSSTGRGARARKRTSLEQQRLVFPQLMRGRDGCLRTYQIHERREFGLFPLKYTFRRARHGRPGCRMSAFCARCAWRCIWGKAPCGRCCEITSSVHNTRTCRAQAVF